MMVILKDVFYRKNKVIYLLAILSITFSVFGYENDTAKFTNELAYKQLQAGNYSQAFKSSKLALKMAEKENNTVEKSRAYSNIASNFNYLGESNKALSHYLTSLELAYQSKNINGKLRAINNIANIYYQLGDNFETIKYRKLHLEIANRHKITEEMLISYIGLIGIYVAIDKIEIARGYVIKSQRLLDINPEPFIQIYYQFALASLLEKEGNPEHALEALYLALTIAKQGAYEGLVVSSMVNIEEINFKYQKFKIVIENTKKSLTLAKKLELKPKIIQSQRLLAKAYEKTNQYKLALEYTKQANSTELNRILGKVKALAEITRIDRQTKETETNLARSIKDQKILVLQIEQQTKNQTIWLIVVVSISIIIFFLFNRRNNKREIYRQKNVNKKLKELDRIKDRILKNTSHELRTPLNGIVGLSEVILADNENKIDKNTLDMVRLIKSSGEQLSLIINDILEMSKSRSGAITIINAEFSLTDLISDVVKVCEPLAIEKNIEINFLQSDTREKITLDKTRLQQILFNIIGNAVKFTDKGLINISFINKNTELVLEIKDTGIGIPIEKIDRIMEGFEQVDSNDTRSKQGSGLGLAISRNICIALGGQLNIQSDLGKGTTVTISLPTYNNKKDSENAQY